MSINICVTKYRSAIMGFATIMVLLFHQYTVQGNVVLDIFSHIGYWGVDIFLFVSGFGIANSLSKNSKSVFFLNRVKKVMPICLVVGLFGLVIDILHNDVDLVNLVPKLFCLNNWYIYTISIYYLFSPIIIKVMKWKAWVLPIMVFGVSLFFSMFSLLQPLSESTHFLINKLPWAWERLFVYLMGVFCYLRRPERSAILYSFGGILFVIVLLAQYGILPLNHCRMQVLAFCIPFVCYSISLLCRCSGIIENVLSFLGRHSLSIFLFHLIIYSILESRMSLIPNNDFRLLVEIVSVIILAPTVDIATNKFLSFFVVKNER